MGMNLFDGSDDTDDISKIETNPEFARRYEHNKKREELDRLKELKKKGLVEDSDESSSEPEDEEDDDEELVSQDSKFLDALNKVKNKDPIINQKDVKLFESESEGEEDRKIHRSVKKTYLKDVNAKQLMEEEGTEFKKNFKSYIEEQDELRKELLIAAQRAFDDDNGELLRVKRAEGENQEGHKDTDEVQKKLDEYFGGDEKLNENDKFLKNYIKEQMWIDKDKGKKPVDADLLYISEDEEEVEKQEKYEAGYNFRYEEGAGDRVMGHARITEGSVRKKTNARQLQRKSKEERMAQAEFERKEELKHMKNLKKKEIMEKLEKIRAIAGITDGEACALNAHDLEEDFDPEEYDRKMKKTFNDGYYGAEDEDPDFGNEDDDDDLEKPDFAKEDELLGLTKDWDVCGSGDGFSAAREKFLKNKAAKKDVGSTNEDEHKEDEDEDEDAQEDEHNEDEDEDEDEDAQEDEHNEDEDEDEDAQEDDDLPKEGKAKRKRKISSSDDNDQFDDDLPEEGKRKRKRKISLREKVALDKDLEEYYKLDYEDTIGDLKTRFKYTPVHSQKYGLKAAEILFLDDKELNQYVPLKKIAPYNEEEFKVPKGKRYQLKEKIYSASKEVNLKGRNAGAKSHPSKGDAVSTTSETASAEQEIAQVGENGDAVKKMSRKSRRKLKDAEFRLSESRNIAYGKNPAKSKHKKKQ